MIKAFHVKNFRSCKNVSLDGIGPILALAGRNGAGKTNVLEAIDWLVKIATFAPWQFGVHVVSFDEKVEGAVTFSLKDKTYRYSAESRVPRAPTIDDLRFEISEELHDLDSGQSILVRTGEQAKIVGGSTFRIGAQAPAMPALLSFLPSNAPHRSEIQEVFNFLSSVRYYPLDEPSHPGAPSLIEAAEYTEWLARYKANPADNNSVPMRILHLSLTTPELFDELKEIVGDNGLSIISRLDVDSFKLPDGRKGTGTTPGEPNTYHIIRFLPTGGVEGVDYNGLSLGTRRVLRIIASVLLDQAAVMLMEQPEDTIHSGLMKKVIGFLRQYSASTQIIMATHSANVFNKMNPEEVRLVGIANGATVVRPLTNDELTAATQYIHDEGQFSDFIRLIDDE